MKIRLLMGAVLALSLAVLAHPSTPEKREVQLDGTRNTRQLGGLPAAGGRVAQGKIYRSGALCFASRADAQRLHGLGIKTILELRLAKEIQKDGPDKSYLTRGLRTLHWPMANSRGLGREAYLSYLEDNRSLFRDFFALLAQEQTYPLLFHCSAGKDRTGILSAMLLEALGTPREIILDDYIHSRRITPKLKVQEDWIQVVFDDIDQAGGIERYLGALGVTQAQLDKVRGLLVEKG